MFLSIVIPIYNGEKFIAQCLASLEKQTYKNFEIIFINDGSTDRTRAILESINSNLDIRVINKSNGGVASARNEGIRNAIGDYILFLDVDDTIENTAVETLNSASKADTIIYGYNILRENRIIRSFCKKNTKNPTKEFLNFKLRICMCSAIWRRKFIINNNIFFNENTSFGEDREFTALALLKCHTWSYIPQILFHYHLNAESATHSIFSYKNISSIYAIERTYKRYINTNYEDDAELNLYVTLLKNYAVYCQRTEIPEISMVFTEYFEKYKSPKFNLNIIYFIVRSLLLLKNTSPYLFKKIIKFI